MRLKLDSSLDTEHGKNCWAFLNENGLPYQPSLAITCVFAALDAGCAPTSVMNRHHVVIVSHGAPNLEEIWRFREQFVAGLGYCPQSLA